MKKLLCALLAVAVLSGIAFAHDKKHHDHKEQFVREEASKRNMTLITQEKAVSIARNRIGSQNARVKEIELDDEDNYYRSRDDFRPVWSMELRVGHEEYEIDIDAVTGEILKYKIDH